MRRLITRCRLQVTHMRQASREKYGNKMQKQLQRDTVFKVKEKGLKRNAIYTLVLYVRCTRQLSISASRSK